MLVLGSLSFSSCFHQPMYGFFAWVIVSTRQKYYLKGPRSPASPQRLDLTWYFQHCLHQLPCHLLWVWQHSWRWRVDRYLWRCLESVACSWHFRGWLSLLASSSPSTGQSIAFLCLVAENSVWQSAIWSSHALARALRGLFVPTLALVLALWSSFAQCSGPSLHRFSCDWRREMTYLIIVTINPFVFFN